MRSLLIWIDIAFGLIFLFMIYYAIAWIIKLIIYSKTKGTKPQLKDLNPMRIPKFIYNDFSEKEKQHKTTTYGLVAWQVIFIMVFVVGAYDSYHFEYGTNHNIGSIYEATDYTQNFYVLMFPDKDSVKNYKVPAQIYSTMGDTGRVYHIECAYMPNGGVIKFDEYQYLIPNKLKAVDDVNEDSWRIELIDEKAE